MFTLRCDKPVAIDSPDHLRPFGCVDPIIYTNKLFNKRLYELISTKALILDIGCGGAGFVKDCLDDGYKAAGLEGSDEPLKRGHSYWPFLAGYFLFTCDVTENFQLYNFEELAKFDVITSWEFLEHIHLDKIDAVMENTRKHMKTQGLYICSISVGSEAYCDLTRGSEWGVTDVLDHRSFHQNINTIEYWERLFANYGFIVRKDLRDSFAEQWIRGPGFGCWPDRTEKRMLSATHVGDQNASINRVFQYIG